ncbi:hypothetical protein HF086_005930 [Spodoptera exigua]|uniref:Uncharacterized protein n=1 Tax=Spodoptera exigua TaxID=7107 RepID=A0A922MUT8_SPOEX|nr:hypothetical protein HF086_005930 [Spodoptera exigua]
MVVAVNVPAMSFGLAVGWVSLASGESGAGGALDEAQAVAAAGTTYLASLVGVPLCARALAGGRKPAVIATSAAFVMSHLPQACWGLKLCGGGWWVVAARACAGVGGAGAWCLAPLLANEVCMVRGRGGAGRQCMTCVHVCVQMCAAEARGAASAALVAAHNAGALLMYAAADAGLPHRYRRQPPAAALRAAGAVCNVPTADGAVFQCAAVELPGAVRGALRAVPAECWHGTAVSEPGRRRTFWLLLAAVVGQEACGVLALLQYAERVFVLARDQAPGDLAGAQLASPARHAVLLGAAQLLASLLALYLIEKVGRKVRSLCVVRNVPDLVTGD